MWGDQSVNAQHFDGTNSEAKASVNASLNAWQHVVGVFATNSSRSCMIHGANKVTNTDARNAITQNRTTIGALRYAGSLYNYFTGRIAEAAIWGAALNDAEVSALAQGYTPPQIRPASLLAYWPLGGHFGAFDLDRWNGGNHLTPYNTPTWTDHCRVIYPRRRVWTTTAATTSSRRRRLLCGAA